MVLPRELLLQHGLLLLLRNRPLHRLLDLLDHALELLLILLLVGDELLDLLRLAVEVLLLQILGANGRLQNFVIDDLPLDRFEQAIVILAHERDFADLGVLGEVPLGEFVQLLLPANVVVDLELVDAARDHLERLSRLVLQLFNFVFDNFLDIHHNY